MATTGVALFRLSQPKGRSGWMVLIFILLWCVCIPVAKAECAFGDSDTRDADYFYQGEYIGSCVGRHGAPIGVQVVALGNGQFLARWYDGGLPGAGPVVLPGHLLRGDRDSFERVVLVDEAGRKIQLTGRHGVAEQRPWGRWRLTRVERRAPTLGMLPPPGARVLFRGELTDQLRNAQLAADGSLLAGATTALPVQDFQLHVEFRTPYMPQARGQGRGNSGIYIQRRYEVQILDSFGLDGKDNECGALYKLAAPAVNMCLPPLAWQTYDIEFRAARWDSQGRKVSAAEITVFHNGVAVHYHRSIPRKTGAGQPEGPEPGPLYFQDHGNPVTFRNLWLVPIDTQKRTAGYVCASSWPVGSGARGGRQSGLLSSFLAGRSMRLVCP